MLNVCLTVEKNVGGLEGISLTHLLKNRDILPNLNKL